MLGLPAFGCRKLVRAFTQTAFEMALHFVAEQENIALEDDEDEDDEDEDEEAVTEDRE